MEQQSRRKETYLYVYKCGWHLLLWVSQQKSSHSRKTQGSAPCRREQQNGKKKREPLEVENWGGRGKKEDEVGKEDKQSCSLSPLPCSQGKKQGMKQSDFNLNSLCWVQWLKAFILFVFAFLGRYLPWLQFPIFAVEIRRFLSGTEMEYILLYWLHVPDLLTFFVSLWWGGKFGLSGMWEGGGFFDFSHSFL